MTHTAPTESARVVDALISAGWTHAGGQAGKYTRLRWPNETTSAIVPTNPEMADYGDLLDGTIDELVAAEKRGDAARRALAALTEAGVIT